jgi:acetate kinase
MGFTALEGLMMGTRCGDLDPGVILYLLETQKISLSEITQLLYKDSGLKGVSGISSDVRDLINHPDPSAQTAIDLFCHYAIRAVGALATDLGGLDVLVFTAGIGEHQPIIRDKITDSLTWLNPEIHVIPTNEEKVIAQHTAALI